MPKRAAAPVFRSRIAKSPPAISMVRLDDSNTSPSRLPRTSRCMLNESALASRLSTIFSRLSKRPMSTLAVANHHCPRGLLLRKSSSTAPLRGTRNTVPDNGDAIMRPLRIVASKLSSRISNPGRVRCPTRNLRSVSVRSIPWGSTGMLTMEPPPSACEPDVFSLLSKSACN